ncbi:acyltransferase family protein [Salinibacterium sp. SYSU T00001]|uniref:acyltransferase family protein n=1 Tax=Homoserinimonas sedimenticola TaxID=2986805 RepID=UPI002235891F|nr:acyltransferase family protein [Salinibacterium sedimenticola]MCW4386623.1 acyltransferase family protein [Salinibacterium sedimenticola]
MVGSAPAEGRAASTRQRIRVPLWDNARFIAVTLVVVGHGIQRLALEDDVALTVYLFIYAFHMPAFAIISGYFSKPGSPSAKQMQKVITDILVPYLIMETIWTAVKAITEGPDGFNPTQPSWTLWFLLALGFFRLILPYLALLRWPLMWAVLLSVGVGYLMNVDSTFSLSRAIGILPFFVLGWKLHEWNIIERWRVAGSALWWFRGGAVLVFTLSATVLWTQIEGWREMNLKNWFFYDDSYVQLGGTFWWAGLVRLALIVAAVVLSAAFFVLIPRRSTWFTHLGQATMYIYLLHSFVLYPIRQTSFLREHSSVPWLIGMIVVCVLISIALASGPVRRIFRPLIEPKPRWLFARGEERAPGPSKVDPTGSLRTVPDASRERARGG